MQKKYIILWIISLFRPLHYPLLPLRLIAKLDKILKKNVVLFEYGSGYSTLWFNKKCKIYGVEHDHKWFKKIQGHGIKNLLFYKTKKGYINSIHKVKSNIDIVLVDGIYRNECLKEAEAMIQKGMLILDDANRSEYNTWWLDKKYSYDVFGGLKMNSTVNSKGYFEINNSKVWYIDKK